ncbi:MAG: glycosyltransferase [Flavobacteriales bacterium]|nr:glycosyltransferase [Flavobacteriales bacterium]
MAERPPILLICATFPPCKGIGGRRWAKYAKALAARGHTVHVVHAACGPDQLGSLWTSDVEHPRIVRHALPPRYPAVLAKRPLRTLGEKLAYRFWRAVLPRLVKGNWLDRAVRWRGTLVPACARLIEQHGIRHVIASGAPFHLLAHALTLKERFPGLRLTADLRDPWTWGDTYGIQRLPADRLAHERALERRVVLGADLVIAPGEAMTSHLRKAYPEAAQRIALVPHPVDPDDLRIDAPLPKDGLFRMLYAGGLYDTGRFRAQLDRVIAVFKRLRTEDPACAARCRYDVYVLGDDAAPWNQRIAEAGLADLIRFHPPLPSRALHAEVQRADVVLLMPPPEKKEFISTKFSELFHLRAPLLYIGEHGALAKAITTGGHGLCIGSDELEPVLLAVLRGERVVRSTATGDSDANLLAPSCEQLCALLFPPNP